MGARDGDRAGVRRGHRADALERLAAAEGPVAAVAQAADVQHSVDAVGIAHRDHRAAGDRPAAAQRQRPFMNGRVAGVGVGGGESQRAGACLGDCTRVGFGSGIRADRAADQQIHVRRAIVDGDGRVVLAETDGGRNRVLHVARGVDRRRTAKHVEQGVGPAGGGNGRAARHVDHAGVGLVAVLGLRQGRIIEIDGRDRSGTAAIAEDVDTADFNRRAAVCR